MKQLPGFVNKFQLQEDGGEYRLTIVLYYREKNKPYNRLSHLIIKDWIKEKLGRPVDPATFSGPSVVSNKSGANVGEWTFKLLEEKKPPKKLDKPA